jgi:hypothetical protein
MKINDLSVAQLRHAAALKEKIEDLETELANLLVGGRASGSAGPNVRAVRGRKRGMSPDVRAKISAAQKAAWAERKGGESPAPAARFGGRRKRRMSDAVRAKLSAIAKARWSRTKAAGRTAL